MFRHALIAAAAFALCVPAAFAQRASEAEAFVETNAQEVITLLQAFDDGEADESAVRAELRAKVEEIADTDRISEFVLGRYRRGADEGEIAEFKAVFQNYAIAVYERELGNYAGQQLTVDGSVARREDDIIVRTTVTGGNGGESYQVNWRVLDGETGFQVVDVEVLGVWLAQNQREQITSLIGNAGGRISAATEVLRERMQTGEPLGED
jgi:phospholipid transport system substrate-binding protein